MNGGYHCRVRCPIQYSGAMNGPRELDAWAKWAPQNAKLLADKIPEFWIGHRTQQWYPPFIEADFLKYR